MIDFYPGVRISLKASFAAVLAAVLAIAAPDAQAQDLYWTTNGAVIMGAERDGTNPRVVFDGAGMAGTSVDVAVTETHIYWTDKNDTPAGGVWIANRDGSDARLFVENPSSETMWAPQFIVIDEANDRLYFTDYFTGLYSARLSDGEDVIHLTGTGGLYAGLAQISATELVYGNGAAGDATFYLTDLTTQTSSYWRAGAGDGQYYGLAYKAEADLLYFSSFGDGTIRSLDPVTWGVQSVVSGLSGVLGLKLSASGDHLVYVERNAGTISFYDLTTETITELVSGEGAFFGVAIWGDPEAPADLPPPDPLEPGTELVHDDFSTGTIGSDLTGTFDTGSDTSDGKGRWINGAGRAAVYGGTEQNKTFLSTGSGLSYAFLTTDVDAAENYSVVLSNVKISAENMDGGSSFLFGARRTGVQLGWAYDFRPVAPAADPTNKFWEVSYIREQGAPQKVIVGHLYDQALEFESLELRVFGDRVRLYIDGAPFDHATRPTQGTVRDNVTDHVLHISLNSGTDNLTLEFDEVRATVIEDPEAAPKSRLWVYEPFDYDAGDLVGGDGGLGFAEPWIRSHESNRLDWPSAQVVAPGQTFGDLITAGNKAEAALVPGDTLGGRAFRYLDLDSISPEQRNADGNIGKPGTSVWISFVAESNSEVATGPFWGIAFFRDNTERLFFGKATNGAALRLSAQGGAQQFGDAISLADKHFIVLRLDFNEEGGHAATLFHNPDPMGRMPTDADALGVYTGAAFEMSFNRLRLASGGGAGGTIDELRIGATWADVTPVPFTGLVNGDLEEEPFTRGWSVSTNVLEHTGFGPGSTTAAFLRRDAHVEGTVNLVQNFPQWIPQITPPRFDPVTGQPMRDHFISTEPVWQLGFYTVVSDPLGANNRSLNVLIGHDAPDPAGASDVNSPQINFRINGDGGAQAFSGGGVHPGPGPNAWHDVFPAGTFSFSALNGPMDEATAFVELKPYYVQFDGDYSGENPSYTVSVRRAGETEFFAVSEPMQAWQYLIPEPGDGIVRIRFHGAVNSPYAVDSVHLGPFDLDGPPSSGYAAWVAHHFGEVSTPEIIGPSADPDGDGVKNLMEYALGLDPLVASTEGLPTIGTIDIDGQEYLTLTFTRPVGLDDIQYDVDAADDLPDWADSGVLVSVTPNGGTEEVVYRHPQPLSAGSRGFLRLDVSFK